MPPCNKEVEILSERLGAPVLKVKCIESLNHEGKHTASVWTNAENKANENKGLVVTFRY